MQYLIVDLIWQMNVLLHLKFWVKLFSFYLSCAEINVINVHMKNFLF